MRSFYSLLNEEHAVSVAGQVVEAIGAVEHNPAAVDERLVGLAGYSVHRHRPTPAAAYGIDDVFSARAEGQRVLAEPFKRRAFLLVDDDKRPVALPGDVGEPTVGPVGH